MVITDEAIQVDRTPSNTPPRRPSRRLFGIGTAIVVVAAVALVALVGSSGPTRSDQTPEPAPRTRDDIVRDLVDRGVVPAATLDDGTQITGPALAPAPRTPTTSSATSSPAESSPPPPSTTEPRSPAQRLHRHHAPATTSSATSSHVESFPPPPSTTEPSHQPSAGTGTTHRDDIVRDLVDRGLVPAATPDDGTQITSPALAP